MELAAVVSSRSERTLAARLSANVPTDIHQEFERHGPVAAFTLAFRRGDLQAASDVLRIAWCTFVTAPNLGEVRALLEAVPPEELSAHPLLAVHLGMLYYDDPFRRAKAAEYFALAASRPHPASHDAVSRAEDVLVLAAQSAALRLRGHYLEGAARAHAALRALESLQDDRASLIGSLPQIYAQLGLSLLYGGEPSGAITAALRGYAEAGPSDPQSFSSLAMLAGIHAYTGDLTEAETYSSIARGGPWTDRQRSTHSGILYRLAEATLALESGDIDAARRQLGAMEYDRRTIEHWVPIAHVEAMVALASGDPAGALAGLEAFARLRTLEAGVRVIREVLASVRILLHLALGNVRAAHTIARRDAGSSPQAHVDRARIALFDDDVDLVRTELQAIEGEEQSSRTWAEAAALSAAAALRGSSRKRADAAVMQLGAILRQTNQRLPLGLVPPGDFAAIRGRCLGLGYGDLFTGGAVRSLMLDVGGLPELTTRELAVLEALVATASTADIAEQLFVSVNTVKSQLRSVYRKLGASSREEAITIAANRHYIRAPRP